jgi:hypothetical protein
MAAVKKTMTLSTQLPQRRTAMKTIVSALLALSVLASIAGSAAAIDAKTFYEQQDRAHY